ncbi:MAG: hypothetical protein ACRCUT_14590 [Spirochaetota bacterium]
MIVAVCAALILPVMGVAVSCVVIAAKERHSADVLSAAGGNIYIASKLENKK